MKNIILGLLLCLVIACDDNEPSANKCEDIKSGIVNDDNEIMRNVIDELCTDLMPQATDNDALGHEENLNILSQRIEENCDITTSILCYACIETFPLQSEISLTFIQNDSTYMKIIDISTPDNSVLSFAGMHN